MKKEQIFYLLALLSIPSFGPVAIHKILKENLDLSRLFNAKGQCILAAEQEINWALIEKDLQWAEKPGCTLITIRDVDYPQLLKEISAPPPLLFVEGNINFLKQPQIAIVGSRNPTPLGQNAAFQFAEYFSTLGITVTSGLALGIDAAAHQGALRGKAGTIAVLGNGLNQIYPKSHKNLAQAVTENGALVSEFSLQQGAQPSHFPRRNRIISGLSLGTLVVEAALKSGSLITANYALDHGREVFAIPGSIHNPLAKGCHQLIQQGAKLVQRAQDVLEEIKLPINLKEIKGKKKKKQGLSPRGGQALLLGEGLAMLLDRVSYETSTIDDLVIATGLTVAEVSSMLIELELNGFVTSVPLGYSRVIPC